MATTRTDGTDPSKNVREQMLLEKRRRAGRPKPSTVISDEATVTGNKPQGGPNPNDEVSPPEFRNRVSIEATLEAPEAEDGPDSDEQPSEPVEADSGDSEELERPSGTFGGKDAWFDYRLANGYTAEELEGLGRNALRDLDDR